ncbi:hypothetical protein [Methanofollis sp. UBA420]|jgi:hypothetical protein|uniref:hypothetical protein n=1 Tax=Methanofollis sp. UBA420 TaxID=1915514 RepID=UPI00316ACAD2
MGDSVSLVIKASFQGGELLDRQIRHIVRMLEKKRFCEVILAFDATETCFIRQYSEPSKDTAFHIAESLRDEGIIDTWFVVPTDDPHRIEAVYERWFGFKTTETHSITDAPMYQQLYAFESTHGTYTLQADADVIICRRDWNHDYLRDMIHAAESAENVVSVGFNIAHKNNDFRPYSSPMAGEYVPEVRICLFRKERFFSLRPFPNELINGKFKLTWYRSLQQLQKEKGLVSLRGGDGRTFYIHPPNTVKKDPEFLFWVMKRVEQNHIPEIQFEHVDLVGTEVEWGLTPSEMKSL